MSLDTFANLKIEIINYSQRNDQDENLDTFIQLAETEMYQNSSEVLNVRSGETRSTASTDGRYLALPPGFIEMRRLRLDLSGQSNDVRFRAPEQMQFDSNVGLPSFFTVTSQIEFNRTPDAVYTVEMQHYAEFVPLSTTNTTNLVLTNNPNIYLFGVLKELFNFTQDTENMQKYEAKFLSAIRGANKLDKRGRYGPAPAMRIEGSTP